MQSYLNTTRRPKGDGRVKLEMMITDSFQQFVHLTSFKRKGSYRYNFVSCYKDGPKKSHF